jgi:hypothetical protein
MAIHINTSPEDWQNAYNELVFDVSSTNATQPNFQFLADINIVGQTNPVSRLLLPKQPSVNTIKFDIGEVIRNYVSYDFNAFDVSGIQACNNSRAEYYVQFGEVYDDASGTPTIYSNLASFGDSGTPKKSSNAIFDFLDWSKTAYTNYNIDPNTIASYKTLNQETFMEKLRKDEQKFITFFDPSGTLSLIRISTLNASQGVIIQSTAGYTPINGIVSVNIAKAGNSYGYYKTVYDSAFTDSSVKYLSVEGLTSAEDPLFQTLFLIDNSCTKYDSVRLHWLNNLGAFDSFTFLKVSRDKTNVERKQFKKFQPLEYAKTFRAKTNYYTKASDSITINSDYLTDSEYEGMKQLIESPIVMMEVDSNTYVPVNIIDTNYEFKKYVNDRRMSNIELTIEYTFDNFRQSL